MFHISGFYKRGLCDVHQPPVDCSRNFTPQVSVPIYFDLVFGPGTRIMSEADLSESWDHSMA